MDSNGVIRQIIEMSESLIDPEEVEENERLERAIALSLTCPEVSIQRPIPAKANRVVRFNLPLLDPPVRVAPRVVPIVPRMRQVRFRPPPAPAAPKPGPPSPPTREQRMSAVMRFYQSTGRPLSVPHFAPEISSSSTNIAPGPNVSVSSQGHPEITPEPEPEPIESDVESFVFDM